MSFPYRIERTRNRHSRAVLQDDVIVIRLARSLSFLEERRHIESLLRRMTAIALRDRSRPSIDPFRPLLSGESSLTLTLPLGHHCTFRLQPGGRTRARWKNESWHVTVGPGTRRRTLNRFLWRLLSTSSTPLASKIVTDINATTLRVPISRIRLRAMTSQWGSCSSRGNLNFHAGIIHLAPGKPTGLTDSPSRGSRA